MSYINVNQTYSSTDLINILSPKYANTSISNVNNIINIKGINNTNTIMGVSSAGGYTCNPSNKYSFNIEYFLQKNPSNLNSPILYITSPASSTTFSKTSFILTNSSDYSIMNCDFNVNIAVNSNDSYLNTYFSIELPGTYSASDCLYIKNIRLQTINPDVFNIAFKNIALGINNCLNLIEPALSYGNNVSFGINNLSLNQTGFNNVSLGTNNQNLGIAGSNNTTLGNYNLQYGTTDSTSYNTACGNYCLNKNTFGNYNTALGYETLYNNTTGKYNTGIGYQAGYYTTIQSNNTFIGKNAGYNVVGENNTFIGSNAGYYTQNPANLRTFDNVCCIGPNSMPIESNSVVIGNSSSNVYLLGGTVQTISDIRDKKNIQDTTLGLDFITKLRPVDYIYDCRININSEKANATENPNETKKVQHGFIAQEVEAINPNFGGFNHAKNDNDFDVKTLCYEEFIAPIVKSIQELKQITDETDNELLNMIENLKMRLNKLEAAN